MNLTPEQPLEGEFLDATKDWVKGVQESQVTGEVVNLIAPNYQVHAVSCNKECHGTFVAMVTSVYEREFGSIATLDFVIRKSYRKVPTDKGGVEGEKVEPPIPHQNLLSQKRKQTWEVMPLTTTSRISLGES